jgi:hypothetical protein
MKTTIEKLQEKINELQKELDLLKPPPPTLEEALQKMLNGFIITDLKYYPHVYSEICGDKGCGISIKIQAYKK